MRSTADAGKARGDGVVADRVELRPQGGAVQHSAKSAGKHEEQDERIVQRRPLDQIALAERLESRGIVGDRLVAEHHLGDAAKQRHRADRDDDRRQPEAASTRKPLNEPQARADREADRERASRVPAPACDAKPIASEASAMMAATERSISRTRISSAMPSAMIAFSEKLKVVSERL